jgi:hypothetical protein
MSKLVAPDLTQRAPRSPRVRLGGYVILPRMLDKGRAAIAGKHGEYKYNCPLDQRFLEFVGISGDKLTKELAKGKGDGEILEWINKQAKTTHGPMEIIQWSTFHEQPFTNSVPPPMSNRANISTSCTPASPPNARM